jgi:hypothetical protein
MGGIWGQIYFKSTSHFDIAAIGVVCALGNLDLPHPDLDWRSANPQLAAW